RLAVTSGDSLLRNPITGIAACCARAASGQAAAPPSAARNSRRPMVTVIRSSRARCVSGTIPRYERAVFTFEEAGCWLLPPASSRRQLFANAGHGGLATLQRSPTEGSIGRSRSQWVCDSSLRDEAALLIATSASNSLQRRLSPPSWLPRLDHLVGPANSALRTNLKSNLG